MSIESENPAQAATTESKSISENGSSVNGELSWVDKMYIKQMKYNKTMMELSALIEKGREYGF